MQRTVSDMAQQWGQQEIVATNGRKALYDRFESIQREVAQLSVTAATVLTELADIKKDLEEKVMPAVDGYNLGQARRSGFNAFGKLLWGAFLALVAAAGYGIHQIISLFTHHVGGG